MKTKKIKKDKHQKNITTKKLLFLQRVLSEKKEILLVSIIMIIAIAVSLYYIFEQKSNNGFFSFPLDDPWIHLQFAKNIIEYGSYSYFKDEVVTSGSTSPLYTFLAALLLIFIKNEFVLSYIIGITFFALLIFFSFKLGKVEFGFSISAIVFALLVALQPKLSLISVSGMETTMFIALVIISIYFYRKEKFLLSGIFTAASLWTRPEALILIGVFFFDMIIQKFYFKTTFGKKLFDEKKFIQFLLPLLILSLLYFLFNYYLSGTLLPNTYKAKIAYYFGQDRTNFLKKDILQYFSEKEFILFPFLIIISFIFIVYDVVKRKYNNSLFYFAFAILFLLAYYIQLPTSHRFGRYLMPVIPFYIMIVLDGIQRVLILLQERSKTDQSMILNFIYSILIILIMGLSVNEIPKTKDELTFLGKYHNERHIKIGKWLRENTTENDVIATHDIGALAFYSNRKIVDMVGLVNPEIIEYLKDKNSTAFLKDHFIKNKVTYFATMRNWFEAVNQNPVFVPVNEFEFFEVFRFEPDKFHIMPKLASEFNQQAIILIQNQNFRGALDLLMRSLRIDPNSSRTLFLIGNVYDFLQDYDNAELYTKRALEIFPEYPEARYELARIYFIRKKYDLAKTEISKAIEIKPNFKEAIQFMITLLENVEKNFDEAKKYRDALEKLQ
ncbi:MAG: tetratricopeptide repeat protein [Ignavibacteria bacterium]|nr:tetratricopeptide repeat protein [Ignavibacteria bacterium]